MMAKEAGFTTSQGSYWINIKGTDDNLKRLIEIVRKECATEIELKSEEGYSILLREHKEAAEWLRSGDRNSLAAEGVNLE